MNKKYLYISIILILVVIFGGVLYYLNTSTKSINKDHIKIKFKINAVEPYITNEELVKKEFLQPLLSSHFQVKNDGTEELFITSVELDKASFCIPVYGINCFRYAADVPLSQSTYTSTTRSSDETSFFQSWDGDSGLEKIVKLLTKGNKQNQLPAFSKLSAQNKTKFIDSLVICKDCSESFIKQNYPLIHKSAIELRKFVNQQIEKFPKELDSKEIMNTIQIFVYNKGIESVNVGDKKVNTEVLPEFLDSDGDSIPDSEDQCPNEIGVAKCKGCKCIEVPPGTKDSDGDGIPDAKDKCPYVFGTVKYKGCPIPDCDNDGFNDEIDNCKCVKGNKMGCPEVPETPNVSIVLDEPNFTLSGVEIGKEYTAKLIIDKGKSSRTISFSSQKCPSNDIESYSINNQLKSFDDLTITAVVYKNGTEIYRKVFNSISYVCFKGKPCGFKKI
jgi:hypothetical protein